MNHPLHISELSESWWRRAPLTIGVTPRTAHIVVVLVMVIHLVQWKSLGMKGGSESERRDPSP